MDRRAFLARTAALGGGIVLAGCGDDIAAPSPSTSTTTASSTIASTTSAAPVTTTVPYDPNTPFWLQGGFAPVPAVGPVTELEVVGSLPPTLNGLFTRNGSNPASGDSPHWFFGDGMVHGMRLENGSASWYANRHVDTPFLRDGRAFGEFVAPPGTAETQANVSMLVHGDRLFSLGEVGWPYEIDPTDLSTIGPTDVTGPAGSLGPNVTAHPKVDPATGLLHFFGYGFTPPYLTYYVASADGRDLLVKEEIPMGAGTMIHDFAITETDVIFWEFPVVFDLTAAAAGAVNPFTWDAAYGSRIGVMPLGGPTSELRWVEIENGYVFHGTNAFRQGDTVVVDVSRIDSIFDASVPGGNDLNANAPELIRWEIGTGGDELTWKAEARSDLALEFPEIDHRWTGRPHSVAWYTETFDTPDGNLEFPAVTRLDVASGATDRWESGDLRQPGETVFVPDSPDAAEGEGWLLTFVWDKTTDRSSFAVLDATDVGAGPVAEVLLPQRVPFGFHGAWMPDT
ncbi:MAG: retinal pigment epithelial membrane protein [Acidimicrobiales bacterium]|nr:MAG: retinal pigment epithelial membrane protein [Acidimicrobiales bacterium]